MESGLPGQPVELSGEAAVVLLLEIILAILDRLHVREPVVIWGLFPLGFALILDSVAILVVHCAALMPRWVVLLRCRTGCSVITDKGIIIL